MTNFSLTYFPKENKKIQDFHIIYRLCDQRYHTHLHGVDKVDCINNFVKVFGKKNLTIIADNCKDPVSLMEVDCKLINTNLGNAGTLKKAFEIAMTFPINDIVYFVEDDFLHLPGSRELILEGLERVDYVTLYFHPDKLEPGPNPYIGSLGEKCNVFRTKSSIWKTTNSTVQTFATKVKTLVEDKDILWKYNFENNIPDSFRTFIELGKKGRILANTIPGRSTHCHLPWITPFIDWVEIAKTK